MTSNWPEVEYCLQGINFSFKILLVLHNAPLHCCRTLKNPHTKVQVLFMPTNTTSLIQPLYQSSLAQSCPALCSLMDCSMPDFSVHHQHPGLTQTHVHPFSDAIQPFHPLLSPSPLAFNLSQHQDLFQWVSSSHQVAKVLEFQLQHQSFQWTFRTDFL